MMAIGLACQGTSSAWEDIVTKWDQLPSSCSEADLESNFVLPLLEALSITSQRRKKAPNIGSSAVLKPDFLIYADPNKPPVLVIENKKRVPSLANLAAGDFVSDCQKHTLYREAVGYGPSNGIQQYLDVTKVDPNHLASYGLVFNGDFFQLWRRVDGLVLPFGPIQQVTEKSLMGLMGQLQHCLQTPPTALVTAIWNQKGGVAKTTNTINLGATLALAGKRVLLIDLDLQGDLTRSLGIDSSHFPGYLQACADKLQLKDDGAVRNILDAIIRVKTFPTTDKQQFKLSVLASSADSLKAFRDAKDFKPLPVFKKLIGILQKDYDYIFMDVSPALDELTQCVLYASDAIMIPMDLGGKALHHSINLYGKTIPRMRELRGQTERLHLGPWNLGIVHTNCPADAGSNLNAAMQQVLISCNFTGRQYQTVLRTYAQVKISEFKHAPVICWRNSPITRLYDELTQEAFLTHNFIDH